MSKNVKAPPVAHFENAGEVALANSDVTSSELELAAYLEVDMTAPTPVLMTRIKQDAETGLRLVITMGLRLLALKGKTEHGEFEDKLSETGVSVREAQKCMQTARIFASETDARRREQILHLGKTKGMALLAANPQVREQILESAEFAADVADGTKRELEQRIKSLEAKLGKTQSALNDQEEINAGLVKRKLKSDLRADTQLVRDECLHQQALCDYGAQALLKAWHAVCEEDAKAPEHLLRRDQIVFAARAAAAATAKVLHEIELSAGDDAPDAVDVAHMLTIEEAKFWASEWETLRSGLIAKDAARFDRAQAELPRDVGRPKGSKTKAGG